MAAYSRTNTATWSEKYNRWQINVQRDGKRKTFTSSIVGRTGQREANKKADVWLDAPEKDRSNERVHILYDEWIAKEKILHPNRSNWGQKETYGRLYIIPHIGHRKIGQINNADLQDIIIAAHGQGLAKKTQTNIRGVITSFFKFARSCHASKLTPSDIIIPSDAPVGERTILQPKDLAVLFSDDTVMLRGKVVLDYTINAYRFETAAGLRPGELFGFKQADRQGNIVNLRGSINQYGEATKGKNKNAERSFALKPIDIAILDKQLELLKELGIESEYYFPAPDGGPMTQNGYYNRWVRYRDQKGLSQSSPYELRHTFVSILKQLPDGFLKALVGHSKDMDTMGTYGHTVTGELEMIATLAADIFAQYVPDFSF